MNHTHHLYLFTIFNFNAFCLCLPFSLHLIRLLTLLILYAPIEFVCSHFQSLSAVQISAETHSRRRKRCRRRKKKDIHRGSPFSLTLCRQSIDLHSCLWFVARNCNNYCTKVFSLSKSLFGCSQNKTNQPFSFVTDFNFVVTFVLAMPLQPLCVCVTHNHHRRQRPHIPCFFFYFGSASIPALQHIKSHIIARVLNAVKFQRFFVWV